MTVTLVAPLTCPAEGFERLEQADDPNNFHTFPQELQQLLGPVAWQLPLVLLAAATSSSSSGGSCGSSGGGGTSSSSCGGGGGSSSSSNDIRSSGSSSAGDDRQSGSGLGDAALAACYSWCRAAIPPYNAQHTAAVAAGRLAEVSALQERMAAWVSDSIGYVVLLLLQQQTALLAAAVAGVAAAIDAGQRTGAAAAAETAPVNGIWPQRMEMRTETVAAIFGMSNGSSVSEVLVRCRSVRSALALLDHMSGKGYGFGLQGSWCKGRGRAK
jgi:hypothetical protein